MWGLGYAFLTCESRSNVQSLFQGVFFLGGGQEWEGGDHKSMLKENRCWTACLKELFWPVLPCIVDHREQSTTDHRNMNYIKSYEGELPRAQCSYSL